MQIPGAVKLIGAHERIWWLKASIVIAFLVALCMSARLWLSSRTYPLVPAVQGLPAIGHPLDWMLFAAMISLLIAVGFSRRPNIYAYFFLAIVCVLCLYDQNRWQPYIYMYGFLLAALCMYSWRPDDAIGRARALNIARLIIASTYFYSGLQKANLVFVHEYFPWITQPVTHAFPMLAALFFYFGFAVPIIQMCFGIGLLTKRFRKVSVLLAVAMHVFVLAMLGPWGLDWNSVVWPWTTAMMFFDLFLFAGAGDFSWKDMLPGQSALHWLVFVLFGVMPLFSFINLWDSDLSAALYSGNLTEGEIYISNAGVLSLPTNLQKYVTSVGRGNNMLDIKSWALGDMNIIEYPETRVFQGVAKAVCSYLPDQTQMYLVVHEARAWRSDPQTVYRCSQL